MLSKILVDNHVICDVTSIVEHCFESEYFSYDCIENLYITSEEDEEETMQDIYSWYRVSDWLCNKLAEYQEPVYRDNDNYCYWGRTTYGQAIYMDYVMIRIAEDVN